MDPKTVQRRRALWWEVLAGDISHVREPFGSMPRETLTLSHQSLALGRPPSISLTLADCEFPTDEEATLNDKGVIQYGCMSSISLSSPWLT